jgi:hypothetical protein
LNPRNAHQGGGGGGDLNQRNAQREAGEQLLSDSISITIVIDLESMPIVPEFSVGSITIVIDLGSRTVLPGRVRRQVN